MGQCVSKGFQARWRSPVWSFFQRAVCTKSCRRVGRPARASVAQTSGVCLDSGGPDVDRNSTI